MTYADLHMHSTASDGALDVDTMLACAREQHIRAVSVTDHDCIDGTRRALAMGASYGVCVVPGVELTTRYDERDVHMLGYFIDVDASCLAAFFAENRTRREQRACAIADNLARAGFPVSAEALAASGSTVNRSTLARLLVQAGCATSIDDAFERLIGKHSPFYVDARYPSALEAIELIHEAGGYAFIAHPAHYGVVDIIGELAENGLDGLEAYHGLQSAEQAAELVALASQLGLAVSGGSDWHGDDTHGSFIGKAGLDAAGFERFCRATGHADALEAMPHGQGGRDARAS